MIFEARWNDSIDKRTFAETPADAVEILRSITHGAGQAFVYKYHSHELVKVFTYSE
jgi:hypothetical protein